MTTTFDLMHALRVKGLAAPEVLSALSGVPVDDLGPAMEPLLENDQVIFRGRGNLGGYLLTQAGKSEAVQLLERDQATTAARDALSDFDEAFLAINIMFKQICQRWQMRDGDRNDHTDTDYDTGVVSDLTSLHAEFVPVLNGFAAHSPRFGRYEPRLAAALERVKGGDQGAFARPMYDSYHDIWMELHNDVVLSLGRERGAKDEQAH